MAVHACFMAILLATSASGATDVLLDRNDEPLLVSADPVLADVNQLTVVLATRDTPGVERMIDVADVKARILQKLGEAGVGVVPRGTETTPRLVVHIEGMEVPGSDQCVFRVQTALDRLVIVPGQGNRHLLTEVWRVGSTMAVVAKSQASSAIRDAALVQTGAFADAHRTARRLLGVTKDTPGVAQGSAQAASQAAAVTSPSAFVASKNGRVFHRPDCRWAQNISADNLVRYQTREEAIASGKNPCKSCKP
ncbi:MAG TPA: Ada metal-binding domain-containing protein [Sedimentisphaerales bacterium]|nr:Ada metal-binding domain-containing protein [Sedimentisphaerales bacterium]HNU28149.1 Ada metal-binding domain-containing protein [Sedimentisphaerales bacterium]